jgi:hypothetical protein
MQYQRGVWVVTAVAAFAVTAAVSAHAAPTGPSVVNGSYSCLVRAERYIDVHASVTLPPSQNRPRPATLSLFTLVKTIKRNGFNFNVPQVFFQAAKNSLKIDRLTCVRSARRIALKPTGLAAGAQTVTPTYLGSLDERCVTTKRVLLHLRITMQSGSPTSALVAVRDDTKTRRAVEFLNWKPRKIKGYFGKSCVSIGAG